MPTPTAPQGQPAPAPQHDDDNDVLRLTRAVEATAARPPAARGRHDPQSAALAREFGMSQRVIDSSDPEAVEEFVDAQLRRERTYQQALLSVRPPQGSNATVAHAPPPVAQPAGGASHDDYDFGEYDDGGKKVRASIDQLDPLAQQIVRSLLRELKGLKGELTQDRAERRTRSFDQTADDAFEALEDTYGEFFGVGSIAELKSLAQTGGPREAAAANLCLQRRVKYVRGLGIDPTNPPSAKAIAKRIARDIEDAITASGAAPANAAPAGEESDYLGAAADPQGGRRTPKKDPATGRFLAQPDAASFEARWDQAALRRPTGRQTPEPATQAARRQLAIKEVGAARRANGLYDNGAQDNEIFVP